MTSDHEAGSHDATAELFRSPETEMRAERAKPKSRRDDLRVAQGKRGTSAALGYGRKMIFSRFLKSDFAPKVFGAKSDFKKREIWYGVGLTQGGDPPALRSGGSRPGLLSCRPSRGSGGHLNGDILSIFSFYLVLVILARLWLSSPQ